MTRNSRTIASLGAALVFAGAAGTVEAQQRETLDHIDEIVTEAIESATLGLAGAAPREIVKNAPFSADVMYETRQLLADGNRIVHKSQSSFARDGVGRTRQQRGSRSVLIDDPIAGRTYVLHPDAKTAVRVPRFVGELGNLGIAPPAPPRPPTPSVPGIAPPAPPSIATPSIDVRPGRVIVQRKSVDGQDDVRVEVIRIARDASRAPSTPELPIPPELPTPPHISLSPAPPLPMLSLHGHPLAVPIPAGRGRGVTEALEPRTIEGVRAEGTRTTYTVPAGAIGNEKPLVTTTERWFSPELQVVMLATTTDPRAGETIYRLANVKRGEPPAELFRLPADVRVRGERKER